ncbi:hypothetical protein AYO21_11699 [Fonsecaea monophora]|uniref:FAD/NAD(P)-binding domain-containing protein n=1 Tax=Fonsecaea monophora TaxID=254056 RepID=A0A177EQE2_9EURO|nr:hypothetical protein AYO21_11699 [Fonsecaea monophora]OAG34167.1 hypothetical protein AYO21_11699 [Fonsecaea monophora]
MRKEYEGVPLHTNAQGYHVPDITYRAPENRRVKVITIGAGFAGILIAYKFQKELQNVELVIYEKNGDIGGTWLENRYPNCACDVPSHSYTFNFALNSEHIWKYLDRICRAFDLRKYMHFNTRVVEAVWDHEAGKWNVKIEKSFIDGSTKIIEDQCDVLLQASGLLNNPVVPNIEGMETFKGRKVHTAQWPDDYNEDAWKGQTIAVIGAGSSSVQTTPGLQPHVKKLHLYAKSRTWLASAQPDNPHPPEFSKEEQLEFATDMNKLLKQARSYEVAVNQIWGAMFKNAPQQVTLRERALKKMQDHLRKDGLFDNLKPDFAVGCRRTTPGVNFMEALNKDNVDVHFTAVTKITEDGIVGADGSVVTGLDTIVFATGFDTTYVPRFKIVGRNGVTLQQKFTPNPDSYLGVAIPVYANRGGNELADIPNYLMLFGPSFPVLAGSVTASLTAVTDLAIAMVKKIQAENLRSISPRQDVVDQFAEHTQTMLHGTVWEDDCNSWYTRRDGRITAVWPGSALHFQDVVRHPRWEDYDITYMNKLNMWEFLGRGFTMTERDPDADLAPYMTLDALDKDFYDTDKTPLLEGPAPTMAQARAKSLEHPVDPITVNGVTVPVPVVQNGGH